MGFFVRFGLAIRLLLVGLIALSGCTADALQPAALGSIRRVGVVSLLSNELRYTNIGATVFNNETETAPLV